MRRVVPEALAVLVVVAGGLVALGHFALTGWSNYLLYSGDSVVLPLVEQTVHRGDPFEWVFSSQLFLFPEGVLYLLSSVISDDPRIVLSINLVVNLVALYVLLRLNTRLILGGMVRRLPEIGLSLLVTAVFGLYVLLERTAVINGSEIASLFLLTTYYAGAIMVGLASTAGILWVTRGFVSTAPGRRRAVAFVIIIGAVIALATLSDPLVAFQATAPAVLAVVALLVLRRASWQTVILPLAGLVGATVLGLVARRLVERFLAADVGDYLAPAQIPAAAKILLSSAGELLGSPAGVVKLVISVGLVAVNTAIVVIAVRDRRHGRAARFSNVALFVAAFGASSAFSLVLGEVLTGQLTTRYLVPAFIFPLLIVPVVVVRVAARLTAWASVSLRARAAGASPRLPVVVGGIITVAMLVAGGASLPPTVAMVRGEGYTVDRCLNDFLGSSRRNGVGSFTLTRQLQLYGSGRGRILQVTQALDPFAWMINLASYRGRVFSYVLLDGTGDDTLSVRVSRASIAGLGTPRQEIQCPSYVIVDYRGTPGEKKLTATVERSVEAERAAAGW